MKNVVVFANCQGSALAQTMLENEHFSSKYKWNRIPPVQSITKNNVNDVLKKVSDADLFIYQPIIESPDRPKEMYSEFLKSQLKDNAIPISFPSIYFDGYFPHLQGLSGLTSVLNFVHDYFIAYACAIGLSEDQLISIIETDDFYSRKLSVDLAERSILILKNREIQQTIDIRLSEFIRNNYKKNKLFNQFNHPKREVFQFLAESIFSKINMEDCKIVSHGESYLDTIIAPIYKSTYNNLSLTFDEDFNVYGRPGNYRLTQREVVCEFFKFYRGTDLTQLKTIIIKNKPFVAELIESHIDDHL